MSEQKLFDVAHKVQLLLQKEDIQNCIVGGLACNLYGSERQTKDVDILISDKSWEKCIQLLDSDKEFVLADVVQDDSKTMYKLVYNEQNVDFLKGKPDGFGPKPTIFTEPLNTIKDFTVAQITDILQMKLAALTRNKATDVEDIIYLIHLFEDYSTSDAWWENLAKKKAFTNNNQKLWRQKWALLKRFLQ